VPSFARTISASICWVDDSGEIGVRIFVGGGLGRTPILGKPIRDFLPRRHLLSYLDAILRVYNRYGRRDNMYKARIKILLQASGRRRIHPPGRGRVVAPRRRPDDGDRTPSSSASPAISRRPPGRRCRRQTRPTRPG
jgi:sulfite reductase beta subunit-like hemoprotein